MINAIEGCPSTGGLKGHETAAYRLQLSVKVETFISWHAFALLTAITNIKQYKMKQPKIPKAVIKLSHS